MEIFNFFENFKKLLIGGPDEKLKNFGKSKKKIIDLYELDNFKRRLFFFGKCKLNFTTILLYSRLLKCLFEF